MPTTKQKLELTRIGKEQQYKLEPRVLVEDPKLSHGDSNTENMLIHGDNLLALKALEQKYTGKIKCIYIDPPYNTGNAFEHYDDGLEHSEWLNLMKPRLEILRNLLSEEGTLFLQLDNNEVHYCKVLLDEIFGRGNYLGDFIRQKKKGGGNDSKFFAVEHEYILVYGKKESNLKKWFLPYDKEYIKRYSEISEDGRKYYRDTFKRASGKQYYPITCPDETILEYDKNGEKISWLRSEPRFLSDLEIGDARIINVKGNRSVQFKQYISKGKKPRSLILDIAKNSDSKDEMLSLFENTKAFDFPKPETLIHHFISMSTNCGDIVLDSFLGSGTTSAVAHKMGRKRIGIELGDHAYTHCKLRMDKVVGGDDGLKLSKELNREGGGGYKFYELGPSLLAQDKHGNYIINPEVNGVLLIQALCKIENFYYKAFDDSLKHGYSTEKDFLHVTTRHITQDIIDEILDSHLGEDETMLVLAKTFESDINFGDRVQIKKIPQEVLTKCEYAKDDYSLPITEQGDNEEQSDEDKE